MPSFLASSIGQGIVLNAPSSDGSNGQALTTDGSGNLSFNTVTTNPAGSDTQLQFNNAGAFGASNLLTFDGDTLAVSGANTAAPVLQVTLPASHADNAIEVLDSVGADKFRVEADGTVRLGQVPYFKSSNGLWSWEIGSNYGASIAQYGNEGVTSLQTHNCRDGIRFIPAQFAYGPAIGHTDKGSLNAYSGTHLYIAGSQGYGTNPNISGNIYINVRGGGAAGVGSGNNGGAAGNIIASIGAGGAGDGAGTDGADGTFAIQQTSGGTELLSVNHSGTTALSGQDTTAPVLQINMPASHADNAFEVLNSVGTAKASINQNGQFISAATGVNGGYSFTTVGGFTVHTAVPAVAYYGQIKHSFNNGVMSSEVGYSLGGVNGYAPAGGDVHLRRYAAATLSLGVAAATAVDQTLEAHPVTGTDIAGADLTLSAGKGTGAGAGGSLKLATPATGVSGTTLQTLSTVLQIDPDDKLGFFGATPVVQPSGTGETVGFTAGAGTGVNDDSTFTGNVGSTAYRISDIVKALKNLGILAS